MDEKTVTISDAGHSDTIGPEDRFPQEVIDEIGNDQRSEENAYDDLPEPSVLSSPRSVASFAGGERERAVDSVFSSKTVPSQPLPYEEASDENAADPLNLLDWPEVQQNFAQRMEEKGQEERDILEEMRCLTETGELQEQKRAAKRLRTRIAYVQHKEDELENKRAHYANVVEAFENALQLLRKG